jgi:hypothetical protein
MKPDMESTREKLESVVQEQAQLLVKVPYHTRNIDLANFSEELIRWAVGPENVIAMLMNCFQ